MATGRSSTWWFKNQAFPRTQAFLALVILSPSTVNSMSSHTQPQKVQVAFATTFNSGMNDSPAKPSNSLQFHIKTLTIRHPRPVRVAAHQPARHVAVGQEQNPARQFAGLGGLA